MTTKANFRRAQIAKRREESFSLKQSVNEMVIPNYNALRDPFLAGFFDQPRFKVHLRKTGVISRKRGLSLKNYKQLASDPQLLIDAEKLMKHRRAKSQAKSRKIIISQETTQNIDCVTEEKAKIQSQQLPRCKRVYKSVKRSIES